MDPSTLTKLRLAAAADQRAARAEAAGPLGVLAHCSCCMRERPVNLCMSHPDDDLRLICVDCRGFLERHGRRRRRGQ